MRRVEVGRLDEVVTVVQDRLKTAIDAKLVNARGDASATEQMSSRLMSVTARVDDKYRKLYEATLAIVKGETDADDALGRIHYVSTRGTVR